MITQRHVGAPGERMIVIRKWSRRKVVHVRLFGFMVISASVHKSAGHRLAHSSMEEVGLANNIKQLDNLLILIRIAILHSSSLIISQCQKSGSIGEV